MDPLGTIFQPTLMQGSVNGWGDLGGFPCLVEGILLWPAASKQLLHFDQMSSFLFMVAATLKYKDGQEIAFVSLVADILLIHISLPGKFQV